MLETKTLTVKPEYEESIIETYASFAWELKSSQEIKNTDSHLERRGDEIYNVTETEHYVKLVFNRDTKMEHYDRIKELENTYFSIMNQEPDYFPVKINFAIAGVLLLMYVIPGVIYLVFKSRAKKKAEAEFDAAYSAWQAKRDSIAIPAINEARELV